MSVTLTGSNITWSDSSTDSTSSNDPLLRATIAVAGNSRTNSASTTQSYDYTCAGTDPIPIVVLEYNYWTNWSGWSDIWFRSTNAQCYADRYKTRADNRDFIRITWTQGAYGGPHTVNIKLFW